MVNEPSPQPTIQAEPSRDSLRDRLLRPSLGKKLSVAFLLFLALVAGNLIVAERLYDGIVDTSVIVDESGRLRYLSQEMAFHSAILAYEKRQDGEALGQLRDEYEERLGKIDLAVRQIAPIVGDETKGLTRLLLDLREAWRSYRPVVDLIRNSPGEIDAQVAVGRLGVHSAAMLAASDAIVNELTRASAKAHSRVDFILQAIMASEVAFILALFLYLRWKVILPVREISRLVSRFAAGDRSVRINFKSRDEIGELARNFNQTADTVGKQLAILDATPDLICTTTPEGRMLYLNAAGRRMLGLGEADDITGLKLADCFSEWVGTVLANVAMPAAARDGIWIGEAAVQGRDGVEIPVSQVVIAHRDTDGGVSHYSLITRDISDRVQLESRLTQSRDFYLKLFQDFPSMIWRSGTDGKCNYFNKAWRNFTGRLLEQELGDGWEEDVHPDDLERCLNVYLEALGKREPFEIEYRMRRHDGEYRWIMGSGTPYQDLNGNFAGYIGACYDITERKQAEEKMRIQERAIESSVNAILITDATRPGNPLIYANPAFERITGYSQEEALGRNCNFLQNDDRDQPGLEVLRQALRDQHEGRAVLRNYRKDGSMFWNELLIAPVRDEAGKVTHFVGVQNDVTERMSYESQLEHQANYDMLTGLPNRNLLQDRLGQTLAYVRRHERELALLFIDLDHFKNINDSLGHEAGDRLLKLVAVRLAGCVREVDTVSRQGGDEFVVILPDVAEEEDVTPVTRKILHAMSEPFDVDGHELFVTCSIGIALYPKDGEDGQTLLKNADAALYRAKDLGRNNAQFYAAEMNLKALERLMLENGLRHALERREFLLHYQPQVDLRSGEIIGMEALVRWQHSELGLVSPSRFIPVTEESGLIVQLGEWVLRTACAQNKAWQRAGLKSISVAVNLSARQFRQPNLVEVVAGILRETGLDPAYLELEVTESLVMQNVEVTIATLGSLKAMGIKLSIDDFGTGYSSLSYLKRFPIDTLKIDQSFVRDITTDPDDAAIAKTIISMAHDLQLKVIAEGVETEAQKSFLQLRRCDEMQGYFFSKPLPAEDFEVLLRERRCLQVADSAAALGQRTLLLLDDEENILASLTRLLSREGYKILSATSAASAFELLAGHQVGVVISDQRMPEMSGVEFLHRVKQIYPDAVRMVLSGYADLKSVTDAINEGAVYKFLTKPWDDKLLRANIREAFQHYELTQDNQRLSDKMASINEELNLAKRELEKLREQDAGEARHTVGVLQSSQEMLESLPVGVTLPDEAGRSGN